MWQTLAFLKPFQTDTASRCHFNNTLTHLHFSGVCVCVWVGVYVKEFYWKTKKKKNYSKEAKIFTKYVNFHTLAHSFTFTL